MKSILLFICLASQFGIAKGQNQRAALKDYWVQCDKILAVKCPDLMRKGLEQLRESLDEGSCGAIEEKYGIQFWFEETEGMAGNLLMDERVGQRLKKYDDLNDLFSKAHSAMYEELAIPLTEAEMNDKFAAPKKDIKCIKNT